MRMRENEEQQASGKQISTMIGKEDRPMPTFTADRSIFGSSLSRRGRVPLDPDKVELRRWAW